MFTPWAAFFSPEGERLLQECIDLALVEDGPELTALGLFPPEARMHAAIRAKEDTLVVGLPVIGALFKALDVPFRWQASAREGSHVPSMTEVARITAPAVAMLKAERVILNFITHLSGIANLTARYVRELDGTGVRLLDTRKTTPGLRWPEKYAVQAGGGVLFLPDKHLGRNMAKKLGLAPDRQHILRLNGHGLINPESQPLERPLLLWPGCCAIHARLKPEQAAAARAAHPGCRVVAHPECRPELIERCDAAGSTSFLIKEAARLAEEAPGSTLVIGTENNLVDRLAARHKGRCRVLSLGRAICPDMAKVTEAKLLATLTAIAHGTAEPLTVEAALCGPARRSLTRMLEVCGQ